MAKNKDNNYGKSNAKNQGGKNKADTLNPADNKGENKKGQTTQNKPAGADLYD
jgi:hypothetical protein